MFKILFIALSLGLLITSISGCGTPMKTVMRDCDRGQKFSQYAYCIKSTYASQGTTPNASAVRAFYANLDAITESYNNKQLTEAQAKSEAYNAFLRTVQASNDRNQSISCYTNPYTKITTCN
jgi:hypothetical protein